jgi:uncharacterized damage-inducible protein DinB
MVIASPLEGLVDLLRDMRTLVERLDDVEYAMPAPGRSSGGIGGHVRHCLDHVNALLASLDTGLCAYDRRARGTDIETNRLAATRAIAELIDRVMTFDPSWLERTVDVEIQLDRSGTMMTTRSTLRRELAFVMNHTVHHNAIVAQMLHVLGVSMGARFGLAPATPAESEPVACAQ